MVWTRFMDMHSGGGLKAPPYAYIYIEAPIEEAQVFFTKRFGHDPEHVTCVCCGSDYSIEECADLAQATAYERGCAQCIDFSEEEGGHYVEEHDTECSWKPYLTLDEYRESKDVLIIGANSIAGFEAAYADRFNVSA